MANKFLSLLAIACCLLAGCEERITDDLSNKPEYMGFVGARYEIVSDLVAYGIKQDLRQGVQYVTLIPPPGIAGPEVGFAIPIKQGSEVAVLKVVKTNRWPDPAMTVIVRLSGTSMPGDYPVRIDLFGGNQGSAGMLMNPKIYRKRAS